MDQIRSRRRRPACATLAAFAACTWCFPGSLAAKDSLQPAGWDAELRLPEAPDMNPDPKIVEVNIESKLATVEFAPGQKVEAWTYNGGLPGPLIRVNVGDRLIVHYKNTLPTPSTIHWHGVRVPIQMDGVPGYSQKPVLTGEEFTYDYIVPDAGLFWYHPHVDSAAGVGNGLYGALLVHDPKEQVPVADELVIVLSDIGVDEHGKLEDPNSGGTTGMAFGREGNHVLINGRTTGDRKITVRSGVPQRWRIVNTAKSRYYALDLDDQAFVQIGGDGGLQEYSVTSKSIVIGAGERLDLIVTPKGRPGTELPFRSYVFNRGYGSVEFRPAEERLFGIRFAEAAEYAAPPLPPIGRPIPALSAAGATRVIVDFTIDQLPDGRFEYGINKIPFWKAKPFLAKLGEIQHWTVTNKTPWTHPLHLHGFFFQVLDENDQPVKPVAWKDTHSVPFEKAVKLLVKFDDDRPGNWMFHCHILDHAEGGLMGTVRVGTPPDGTSDVAHEHPK